MSIGLTLLIGASSFVVGPLRAGCAMEAPRAAANNVEMINLFGNTDESNKRRDALSFRDARPGDRKVTFRKPNAATQGIVLGLKFRESFGKGVFIDKIVAGTEAARLEQQGKLKVGDEITMVSATFGDEMWSARGIGKYRLEKSIAVRQGATISFVVESPSDGTKKARAEALKKQNQEQERLSRLQQQLAKEVEAEKKKSFWPW